jgi:hypothetical protein
MGLRPALHQTQHDEDVVVVGLTVHERQGQAQTDADDQEDEGQAVLY